MLVYRVELPDGTGPWCNNEGKWHSYSGKSITGYDSSLSKWSNPTSFRGKPPSVVGVWRYGFTSWEHFFNYCQGGNWDKSRKFKLNSLNIIKEKEMFISVYEVDDKHIIDDGYTQCIFRIAEATLVERLDSLSDVVMEQLSIYLGELTKKEKDEQESGDISFIKYPGHQTNYEGVVFP